MEQHVEFMRRTHCVANKLSDEFQDKFDTYQAEIERVRNEIKAKMRS